MLFRSWRRRGPKVELKLCEFAPALIRGALSFKGLAVSLCFCLLLIFFFFFFLGGRGDYLFTREVSVYLNGDCNFLSLFCPDFFSPLLIISYL